jgi:thiamine-phosphate pyrophosphorylase
MKRRHLPRLWLMTDERMGDGLFPALECLPRGSGVIFRHYSLAKRERATLLRKARKIAKARQLVLLIGGKDHHPRFGAVTAPVHSIPERIAAERAGAKILFVSPVFPTRSHPGARALGRVKFGILIHNAKAPVVALGGMDAAKARSLAPFKIHGWAAIDALTRQKRKAVPT